MSPCEITKNGVFICWRRKPKEVAQRCACNRRATLLCDGPAPAGSSKPTCDAPLCRACAVRPVVMPLRLPSSEGGSYSEMGMAKLERRRAKREHARSIGPHPEGNLLAVQPRLPVPDCTDTTDFCQGCYAKSLEGNK